MTTTPTFKNYATLLEAAKAKANRIDNDVAIVVWGPEASESAIVECHRKFTGNDMSKVNELLEAHSDAEILEIVGSDA
jgi:hypothetical protein